MLHLSWWAAWYHLERAVWLAEPLESFASAAKHSSGHCHEIFRAHTHQLRMLVLCFCAAMKCTHVDTE